jgi:hypothetical protein
MKKLIAKIKENWHLKLMAFGLAIVVWLMAQR